MKREVTLNEALTLWGQWKQQEREAIVWDIALPKMASTEFQGMMSIYTEGKKYRLALRENIDEPENGLITVEVSEPYQNQIEGRSIIVTNDKGEVFLEGKIVSGRVAQKVKKIRDIDLKKLFVKPKD
ncbi:MAG: hypothetical protein AB1422_07855 [bacterium]